MSVPLATLLFVAGPIALALMLRAKLPTRPLLGAWLVVGASVLGVGASIWWRVRASRQAERERMSDAIDGLCRGPAGTTRESRALHELQCAPGVRGGELVGEGPTYGKVKLYVSANDRTLALISVVAAGVLPAAPAGQGYVLWLEDEAGKLVASAPVAPREQVVLTDDPALARVRTARLTVEPAGATTPTGPLVGRATLARLR